MKASDNPVVGRWRIVEADLWDRDYLDLCGPASLVIRAQGDGEIAFGAMQPEVSGSGSAELQDDGSLEIEIEFHLGDGAVLKAVRDPSSTAC